VIRLCVAKKAGHQNAGASSKRHGLAAGCKLSDCPLDEITEFIAVGQECFLTQLLQVGFFHADPHPGNIMRMNDQTKVKIALIDFGLVACAAVCCSV